MFFDKSTWSSLWAIALAASAVGSPVALEKRATLNGIDVSDFTTGVNFNTVKANGASFVYIKATEGTSKQGIDDEALLLTK